MTPKIRRVLLNENYSSQRARRWWAITSPLVSCLPLLGWPAAGRGLRLRNDDVRGFFFVFLFFFLFFFYPGGCGARRWG